MRWLASRRALPLSPVGRYGPEASSGGIERPLGFPPSSARQPLERRAPHPPAEVPMAPGQALRPPDWPVSCACWFCPSGTRLPSGPVRSREVHTSVVLPFCSLYLDDPLAGDAGLSTCRTRRASACWSPSARSEVDFSGVF